MKVYLSHPFGGKEENRTDAARIANGLKSVWKYDGVEAEVVNPLEVLKEHTGKLSEDRILKLAVGLMQGCDGVIFAPGWRRSRGCRYEHMAARRHGLPRILLDEESAGAFK